jgi:PAS domain S-box-containing protein
MDQGTEMVNRTIQKRRLATIRIVAIYALFGLAWIYGSDTALGWLVHDREQMVNIAVIKGSLFILSTAALLYFLISRFVRQLADAETARIESMKNYEAIFNATNEAILVLGTQSGDILEANDRVTEMFGYDLNEILSLDIGHLSGGGSPYSQSNALAKLHLALIEGPQVFEWHSRRKSGQLFWSEVSLRKIAIRGDDRIIAVIRDVTERKQSEDALRVSESNFRRLYENIMDGFATVDMLGAFQKWNKAFEEMLGYSSEELAALDYQNITPVKWHELEGRIIQNEVIPSGFSSVYEKEYIRKDGTVFPVELRTYLIKDEAGIARGMWAYVRDITERKRLEDQREAANERFKSIMDSIDALVYVADMQTNELLFINEYGKQLFGNVEGQLCWQALQCGQSGPCDFCTNDRLLLYDGQPADVYVWEFKNTVSGKWYQCRDKAIRWNDNQLVRLEIATDITDRKQFEESLRQTRISIEHASDALFWITPDARFTDVNEAACRSLGYSREELLQLSVPEVDTYYDAEKWPMHFAELRQRGSLKFESEQRTKDGRVFPVEIVANHVQLGADERNCAFVRDISERKRIEADKIQLETQLQQAQKMESVGRLAGGVAHDFNNMLTVIIGHSDLALKNIDPDSPFALNFREIRKTAERSADLTQQLLAFARKQTVSPRELNLNGTIEKMIRMLQALIGEDIRLDWQPDMNLWQLKIDPSQIDQIMANLCVNARDAIKDTGVITIATTNRTIDSSSHSAHLDAAPGEYVQLSVRDNGCGMDKETLEHIFEPFYTTKELGKGTGLGLSTLYGIVKQNNGFIEISSNPAQGTEFSICLPRYVGSNQSQQKESSELSCERGHETILLVEDDAAILDVVTKMLVDQGFTVLTASTPGEAIQLAREHVGEIKLLMTDVIMPEMNGRELAKNLLSLFPNMKRLFMSGYTADVIAHHGVLDEGVHFIQKPFSQQFLVTRVREVLDA